MIDRLFLSVGAMKAGTTWLHQQLAGHQDVAFCPEKEIHYFADPDGNDYMSLPGRLARYQRVVGNIRAERVNDHVRNNLSWYSSSYLQDKVDDNWYSNLFSPHHQKRNEAAYCADFSNLYATLDENGWQHVRRIAKQVRVVYTMRHPSKRLWSQLKFGYEFGGDAAAVDKLSDSDFRSFLESPGNFAHADYASVVERLRCNLDESEVLFLFFEDFRNEPLGTLRKIERFLDISPQMYNVENLKKQVNPTQSTKAPEAFSDAAGSIHREQVNLLSKLDLQVPESWYDPAV